MKQFLNSFKNIIEKIEAAKKEEILKDFIEKNLLIDKNMASTFILFLKNEITNDTFIYVSFTSIKTLKHTEYIHKINNKDIINMIKDKVVKVSARHLSKMEVII